MIASPRMPTHFATPRSPVTIVAANLHYTNPTPVDGARAVVVRHADVVVISEGTPVTEAVLAESYPYQLRSGRHGNRYGEFIVSRVSPAPPHGAARSEPGGRRRGHGADPVPASSACIFRGPGIKGVPYLGAKVTFAGQQPPVERGRPAHEREPASPWWLPAT